jgi:hypothetical protein
MKMTDKKYNPNPFIRLAQETKEQKRLAQETKEQKRLATGLVEKSDKQSHTGAIPNKKITPRASKIERKAGRGR